MRREKSAHLLLEQDLQGYSEESGYHADEMDDVSVPSTGGAIDHERARQLLLQQTRELLPPSEANALADHLLECDSCFRYAQEVADRERKRTSGELKER